MHRVLAASAAAGEYRRRRDGRLAAGERGVEGRTHAGEQWSRLEEQKLREMHAAGRACAAIALELRRSIWAVDTRRQHMGLPVSATWYET